MVMKIGRPFTIYPSIFYLLLFHVEQDCWNCSSKQGTARKINSHFDEKLIYTG